MGHFNLFGAFVGIRTIAPVALGFFFLLVFPGRIRRRRVVLVLVILLQDLIRFLDSCSEQEMAQAGTRSVLGAEALLRWNSAEIGPIPPDEFIGLAEQSGLIESIGEFVLESGCRQFRDLVGSVGQPLSLAVNVSPQQFRRGDLPQLVARVLDKTGFAPERLKLEVTEGLLLGDQNQIKVSLHNLHDMGVKLSMDDFGTGYSSLRYLRNFN
ncbi:MAG: EAL domain-containing protein, partial [Gammaproteobacteria bacterium]|nr:EAL domain-containing protein [Gammaproteobacteria bacterium]